MKQLLLMVLIFFSGVAMAQDAVVKFHDGRVIRGEIFNVGYNEIYLQNEKHDFNEIKAIAFTERNDEHYGMTYKKLEEAGIVVTFNARTDNEDSMYPSEEELQKRILEAGVYNEKLYVGLERFRRSYTTGTGLILVGAALSTIGVLAANESLQGGGVIIGAGSIASIFGFIVMAGAGKHLKHVRPYQPYQPSNSK